MYANNVKERNCQMIKTINKKMCYLIWRARSDVRLAPGVALEVGSLVVRAVKEVIVSQQVLLGTRVG